jgi:hypothetical protein
VKSNKSDTAIFIPLLLPNSEKGFSLEKRNREETKKLSLNWFVPFLNPSLANPRTHYLSLLFSSFSLLLGLSATVRLDFMPFLEVFQT